MTQPTVSKHWRKIGPKDKASIPSGPPHRAHNDTTTMQYTTKTHKIRTNTNKSTHSEMGPVWQNPIQRTVSTANLTVLTTVQLRYTIQHRTVLIISPLTSRQTHSSDAVYQRGGGDIDKISKQKKTSGSQKVVNSVQYVVYGSHNLWKAFQFLA